MISDSGFRVRYITIVVTADSHNPSILTADFLAAQGLAPEGIEIEHVIAIPPLSLVRYVNGVEWTLDRSRLAVREDCQGTFQGSYDTHAAVVAYLRTLSYVPYQSLGLNWLVTLNVDEPRAWLSSRFLANGPWASTYCAKLSMTPRFTIELEGAQLNVAFGEQANADPDLPASLVMDCNVHHEGPMEVRELCNAIENWQARQKSLVDVLSVLCCET